MVAARPDRASRKNRRAEIRSVDQPRPRRSVAAADAAGDGARAARPRDPVDGDRSRSERDALRAPGSTGVEGAGSRSPAARPHRGRDERDVAMGAPSRSLERRGPTAFGEQRHGAAVRHDRVPAASAARAGRHRARHRRPAARRLHGLPATARGGRRGRRRSSAVLRREGIRNHFARRRRRPVADRAFELVRPPLSHPPHRRARRLRVRAGERREKVHRRRPRQERLPDAGRVRAAARRSRSGLHQLLPSRSRRRVRARGRRGVLAAGGQRREPAHSDGGACGRGRRLGGGRPGGQGVRAAVLHGNAGGTGIRAGGARRAAGNLLAVRLGQHVGRLSVLRRSRLLDEAGAAPATTDGRLPPNGSFATRCFSLAKRIRGADPKAHTRSSCGVWNAWSARRSRRG